MFAGQKPDPTWRQVLQGDDREPPVSSPEPNLAKPSGGFPEAVRPSPRPIVLMISLAAAAVISAGLIGALALRQAVPMRIALPPASTTHSSLPPLGSSLPPLVEASLEFRGQAVEPELLPTPEPPPIQIGVPQQARLEATPPRLSTVLSTPARVGPPPDSSAPFVAVPMPPPRPPELSPGSIPAAGYDKWTAVYDISAHTVYLPGGMRLEAHSGLGDRMDDPRFVDERDRGATPPNLYQLTLRELLFHGVQALRLTPIGGGFSFDRVGLLAHPYMLGPNGDSNGCVSFKNYAFFLQAFMSGEVKRLAVVARLTEDPARIGPLASLRRPDH